MSKHNGLTVTSKTGVRYFVRPRPKSLPEVEETLQTRTERKFNIRIKQHDRFLLDELAKAANRTRSELINELLHRILLDELMSIEALDARMLVAKAADDTASYDPLARHWTIDVLAREIDSMAQNILEHGDVDERPPPQAGEEWDWRHSEEFLALRAKLKEVGR